MKKSFWAVAPALCLASGLAMAQSSSVTLYGVVDAGIQFNDSSAGNLTSVVSGGRSGSRFGFRGAEDLGGGLSAIFTLENGFNADTGMQGQGNRLFGRQAFVGVKGGFGTVAAGRLALFSSGTGSFDMFGDQDPLVTGYGIAGVGGTFSSAQGLRADNSLLYVSPEFGGVQVGAMHSFQFNGAEVSPRGANGHVSAFGVRFGGGPLKAAITYDVFNNPAAGASDEKHLQLGVSYDLKFVQLFAAFAKEDNLFSTTYNVSGTTNGAGAKAYMVGATAPLGAGILRASHQRRNGETRLGENRDYNISSVAYEYNLSKRTMVYGAYSDSNGKGSLANNATYDRKVVTAGMLHRF